MNYARVGIYRVMDKLTEFLLEMDIIELKMFDEIIEIKNCEYDVVKKFFR